MRLITHLPHISRWKANSPIQPNINNRQKNKQQIDYKVLELNCIAWRSKISIPNYTMYFHYIHYHQNEKNYIARIINKCNNKYYTSVQTTKSIHTNKVISLYMNNRCIDYVKIKERIFRRKEANILKRSTNGRKQYLIQLNGNYQTNVYNKLLFQILFYNPIHT